MANASRRWAWLGWAPLVGVGAAVLLWAPLANGFPLIYHDTGTYLLSSYTLRVPTDRPVGYSLFILLTRVYPSVWAPIVAQALATSCLLLRGAALLLPDRPWRGAAALGVLVATAAVTSLSGFVGYLMPDVFADWIPLGVLLVLLGTRRLDRVAGAAAVALAMFVHNGNVYLALAAVWAVLVVCWLVPAARGGRRPAAALAVVALLVVPVIGTVHRALGGGFTVSRGAPTQLLNKLVATGVVDGTLAAYCPG